MNIKNIKALIELINESNLETLAYKDAEFELELKKSSGSPLVIEQALPQVVVPVPTGEFIKSRLVGVFYIKPSPEAPDYVGVGSRVEKGDVICIIEAMKVMNEITSPISGTIEEILVSDGAMVEFDQPLFRII